eukprot:symbB.v1.2.041110.t1/scaffold7832.1/size9116/1
MTGGGHGSSSGSLCSLLLGFLHARPSLCRGFVASLMRAKKKTTMTMSRRDMASSWTLQSPLRVPKESTQPLH